MSKKKTKKPTKSKKLWTPAEERVLKKLWPNTPTKQIQITLEGWSMITRTPEAIDRKASRMGLRRTPRYLREWGLNNGGH